MKLRYDLVGGKKVKNVVILNAYLGARLRGFRPEKQKISLLIFFFFYQEDAFFSNKMFLTQMKLNSDLI